MNEQATFSPEDPGRAFRDALGAFATGVTIATTLDADGAPVGVTASSFNSVSVDPPLVLWSLARSARSLDAFCSSGHFAVHVLAAGQERLSNRFASQGDDKFAGLEWQPGTLGSPVLEDYAARFECRTRHLYEGGDHVILVGEVVEYLSHDVEPLLFHAGRYATRRPDAVGDDGAFPTDLIAQAYDQLIHNVDRGVVGERLTGAERGELERLLRKLLAAPAR